MTFNYSDMKVRIYVNGILKTTSSAGSGTADSDASNNLLIGLYTTSVTRNYDGSMDDVKIYNYVRSASQIAYDYNQGDPMAWYKMNECTGSTIHSTNDPVNTALDGFWYGTGGGTQTSVGNCSTAGTAWGAGASGKYGASLNFDGTDDYFITSTFLDTLAQQLLPIFRGEDGYIPLLLQPAKT